jgi:micrococcal nuclease
MPRYRRSFGRELIAAAVVVLLVVLRLLSDDPAQVGGSAAIGRLQPGVYRVLRVVDGDTLLLEHDQMRVRLQGIDTPETVKEDSPVEQWGPEASEFTKAFVREAGGMLRMEIDGEPLDRHGRHLAFAWSGERMLNEELVRNGLARATLQYNFSQPKKEILRRAQREAKRERLGIWSSIPASSHER